MRLSHVRSLYSQVCLAPDMGCELFVVMCLNVLVEWWLYSALMTEPARSFPISFTRLGYKEPRLPSDHDGDSRLWWFMQ